MGMPQPTAAGALPPVEQNDVERGEAFLDSADVRRRDRVRGVKAGEAPLISGSRCASRQTRTPHLANRCEQLADGLNGLEAVPGTGCRSWRPTPAARWRCT